MTLVLFSRTWIEGDSTDKDADGRGAGDTGTSMSEFTLETGLEESKESMATSTHKGGNKHTWLYIQMELCNRYVFHCVCACAHTSHAHAYTKNYGLTFEKTFLFLGAVPRNRVYLL